MSNIVLHLPAVGARSDFSELQYISALHQSGKQIRNDGSIRANDIARLLSSRYGIRLTDDDIFKGICLIQKGEKPTIQLPEVASILLVPFFVKARRNYNRVGNELTLEVSDEIIRRILAIMIHDTIGRSPSALNQEPPLLNRELIQSILRKYGLSDLARDQTLLDDMIQCIGSSSQVTLDTETFITALTQDILLYDADREFASTTNYFDVFRTSISEGGTINFKRQHTLFEHVARWNDKISWLKRDSKIDVEAFCVLPDIETETYANQTETFAKRAWTSSSVDVSADTMQSKLLIFSLLLGFFMAINSYSIIGDAYTESIKCTFSHDKRSSFKLNENLCELGISIGTYFVRGLIYGVLGWLYVGLGSLGNTTRERTIFPMCISIVTILCANLYFIFAGNDALKGNGNLAEPPKAVIPVNGIAWKDEINYATHVGRYLSIILGFLSIGLQLINILRIVLLRNLGKREEYRSCLFMHPTVEAEAKLKQASARKLNALVNNAMEVHTRAEQSSDRDEDLRRRAKKTFRTLFAENEKTKKEIGLLWTLKRVFSGELLAREGIWISSRAFAATYLQIAAIVWFLSLILSWVKALTVNAVDMKCSVEICGNEDLCVQQCRTIAFCVEAICSCNGCGPVRQSEDGIKISALLGAIVGVLNMIFITSRYIPMYIATVLKFRYGVLESLDNEEFSSYRTGLESVWLILGYAFWGPIVSSSMISLIIAGIIYCFIDPALQLWAIRTLSVLIGVWIAVGFKALILFIFQRHFMGGFYRKRPARANFIGLFFECWNLFLAQGYTVFRVIKILLITMFHAGRIDTPILAKRNTPLGPKTLTQDLAPHIFIQDCLLHEAHRHPYLELLGKFYLYKLRYEDRFVSRAGTCWRLLFTLTLLPWLETSSFQDKGNESPDERWLGAISSYRSINDAPYERWLGASARPMTIGSSNMQHGDDILSGEPQEEPIKQELNGNVPLSHNFIVDVELDELSCDNAILAAEPHEEPVEHELNGISSLRHSFITEMEVDERSFNKDITIAEEPRFILTEIEMDDFLLESLSENN